MERSIEQQKKASRQATMKRIASGSVSYLGLVVLLVLFGILTGGKFLSVDNLITVAKQGFTIFMAALAEIPQDVIEAAALDGCDAGVLHVTPYHSYPSGVTASAVKRHAYAAWAGEHNSVIVEDDYDAEFASPTRRIETIFSLDPRRVIYLNTFSKLLAPSVRTGFLVLPEGMLPDYRARLDFYSCTVPVFDQLVLAEFINAGHMERYIGRRRRALRRTEEDA